MPLNHNEVIKSKIINGYAPSQNGLKVLIQNLEKLNDDINNHQYYHYDTKVYALIYNQGEKFVRQLRTQLNSWTVILSETQQTEWHRYWDTIDVKWQKPYFWKFIAMELIMYTHINNVIGMDFNWAHLGPQYQGNQWHEIQIRDSYPNVYEYLLFCWNITNKLREIMVKMN